MKKSEDEKLDAIAEAGFLIGSSFLSELAYDMHMEELKHSRYWKTKEMQANQKTRIKAVYKPVASHHRKAGRGKWR